MRSMLQQLHPIAQMRGVKRKRISRRSRFKSQMRMNNQIFFLRGVAHAEEVLLIVEGARFKHPKHQTQPEMLECIELPSRQ